VLKTGISARIIRDMTLILSLLRTGQGYDTKRAYPISLLPDGIVRRAAERMEKVGHRDCYPLQLFQPSSDFQSSYLNETFSFAL